MSGETENTTYGRRHLSPGNQRREPFPKERLSSCLSISPFFHQEGRGLEREKPERNCVRMRTGSHSLRNDSVLRPSHSLHIGGMYFSFVYSTEFEDDNANKKKNSNDHVLNTYV